MAARPQAARPKRAAEAFARVHHGQSSNSSKKPRFDIRNPSALAPDAPEEDAVLELDEVGKSGGQTKRNAVNIDGYDSDSSNEGFNGRADARARAERTRLEEENDMFADLAEEESDVEGEKNKKLKVKFLDEDKIAGQEDDSKEGGHVKLPLNGKHASESESEDEEEEEEEDIDEEVGAGGLKKNAPTIDAFNMKKEHEEGRFDEQQNYIRKAADPDAIHDSWLEGVSKKDMKRAAEAAEKREEEVRAKRLQDDQVLTKDILTTLIQRMSRGETVLEALARLGKGRKKNEKGDKKDAIEAITGAADQLFTRGQTEIYEAERELLIRQYRKETGEDWVDGKEEREWEYRFADGQVHGPYAGDMMIQWRDAGYFADGVEFRPAGSDMDWDRVLDI